MAGNLINTYGDVSIREDVVLNSIKYLTAEENTLLGLFGDSKAISTVHSYLVDTLRTAASAAVSEEGDYTVSSQTTPTRLTNIVEKVAIPIKVTRTQQLVDHYHGDNELQRQTKKSLMDWGNSMEFDLLRATLTSGVSGTAAKMNGVIAAISKASNTTVHTSGTTFNASHLEGLMKANWLNSNGEVATDVLFSAGTRKRIDDSTQKSSIVVNQANGLTDIVKMTTTYTTSFGKVACHTHRYVYQSGDATDRIVGVNRNNAKIAWLRKPFIDTELARSGDYDVRAVVGDATLEIRNQDSFFFAGGWLIE